jgi:phosphohistidine swiveling domain-containing protein
MIFEGASERGKELIFRDVEEKTVRQLSIRLLLAVLVGVGMSWVPAMAGSAAIGSVAGSRNATLSGEAAVPNTTVFSGDSLAVRQGVAVVAMERGSRMVFGQQTEASFLRAGNDVTVLLGRGNVSLYHPEQSVGLQVKAGGVTVAPVSGYKTLGEVAMLDGAVQVTAKEGTLAVEGQGRSQQVSKGQTVTVPLRAARAPMPNPPSSEAHITTATTLGWMAVGAGGTAAVLAGIGMSRSNDAKNAAAAATAAANAATTAANNATTAANNAANAANAVGCALNKMNADQEGEDEGEPVVSPYTPPTGYSCP